MSNENVSGKKITIIFVVIGVCSLLLATWAFYAKNSLESLLSSERLNSERLLSEKLLLDKAIEQLKEDSEILASNQRNLEGELAILKAQLEQRELALKKIQSDNYNRYKLISEINELKQTRSDYENQLALIQTQLLALQNENKELLKNREDSKNIIAKLQSDNEKLSANLAIVSSLVANNLLEVTKKNERLTINSKRARKIMLSFDVPSESYDKIDVRIIDPNEIEFTKKNGISFQEVTITDQATASIKSVTGLSAGIRRLQFTYAPTSKLKPGIYKADIYNNNTFIGRVQVRLK